MEDESILPWLLILVALGAAAFLWWRSRMTSLVAVSGDQSQTSGQVPPGGLPIGRDVPTIVPTSYPWPGAGAPPGAQPPPGSPPAMIVPAVSLRPHGGNTTPAPAPATVPIGKPPAAFIVDGRQSH